MKTAREQLNPYARALEDAQGEIRALVKRAFFSGMPRSSAERALEKIINAAVRDIKIERLKQDAKISLLNFANKQRALWLSVGLPAQALLFLGAALTKRNPPLAPAGVALPYSTHALGVPLGQYYKTVWQERVQPVLNKLVKDNALDPNDFTGRNSLRNLAEMEVRYRDHEDNIGNLRSGGARLVVCSSHADCSGRCAPWQGRVYSLDGTSGTVDGLKYVPLERATEIYYTTKAGRTYKNGLLGFNCRHYLTEYKGALLPVVSAEERKKEYAVTLKQREMERAVRKERAHALYSKELDEKAYRAHSRRARELYAAYKDYCKQNGRAYYPMRVQI